MTYQPVDLPAGPLVVASAAFRGWFRAYTPDGLMLRVKDGNGVVGPGLYTTESAAWAALEALGYRRAQTGEAVT